MLPDQNSQSVEMFVQTYDRNLGKIYDELFWGYEIKYIKEQIDKLTQFKQHERLITLLLTTMELTYTLPRSVTSTISPLG